MKRKYKFVYSRNRIEKNSRTPTNAQLFIWQNGQCFYCNLKFFYTEMTRDHLFSRANNNTLIGNKVLACQSCNIKKGRKEPILKDVYRAAKMYNAHKHEFIIRTCVRNDVLKLVMVPKPYGKKIV